MSRRISCILASAALLLVSCSKGNEGILDKEQMTALLVDVHKTEAVIALNYSKYPNDSAKSIVREAVFERHKTSKAQFDSSLVWYGNHIEEYMEIYDQVIDRLNRENEEVKELIAKDNSQILTRPGDSVDIWKQERTHIFNPAQRANVLAFDITADENFKAGDRFILKIHTINAPAEGAKPRTYLAARHDKQNVHYTYGEIEHDGWTTLKIQCDTASRLNSVYGSIVMPDRPDCHIMYMDSIILLRLHDKAGMEKIEYKVIDAMPNRTASPQPKKTQRNAKEKKAAVPASLKRSEKDLVP